MATIGGPKRIGNIGSSAVRRGGIGSPVAGYGSSLIKTQDDVKSDYPTTTTEASPETTTTAAAETTTTTALETTTTAPVETTTTT